MAAWASYKGFEPAAHHLLIMRELEEFIPSDEFDVLLLHAPPGCAKSTYISALFPPWYFANFPQNNILFATHSDDFAHRWGRRVRNDMHQRGRRAGDQHVADERRGRSVRSEGGRRVLRRRRRQGHQRLSCRSGLV